MINSIRNISSALLLIICIALLFPLFIFPESQSGKNEDDRGILIIATLSDTAGLLGDKKRLTVTVEYPGAYDSLGALPPGWNENVHIFSTNIEKTPSNEGDKRKSIVYVIEFAVFETGDIRLSSLDFRFRKKDGKILEISSLPVMLRQGGLVGDDDNDIKDIKAPLSVEGSRSNLPLFLGLLTSLVIVLALIYYFFIYKKGKLNGRKTIRKEAAHIEAYRALDSLSRENLLAAGQYKQYYIRLSDVMKVYLNRRFDIETIERTTREILSDIRKIDLSRYGRRRIGEFFDECDLVKFAKFIPTGSQAREEIETAYFIVDVTREETVIASMESPAEEKHPAPKIMKNGK